MLVGTQQAEIYEAVETEKCAGREVFGCAFATKRSYLLGRKPQHSDLSATLNGTVAGYEVSGEGVWIVVSRNLTTGKVVHHVPTGRATHSEPKYDGSGPTAAIVVAGDGSSGWIVTLGVTHGGYAVEVATRSGVKLLASGSEIDSQSLAIAGSTMHWTNGGRPYSALLH